MKNVGHTLFCPTFVLGGCNSVYVYAQTFDQVCRLKGIDRCAFQFGKIGGDLDTFQFTVRKIQVFERCLKKIDAREIAVLYESVFQFDHRKFRKRTIAVFECDILHFNCVQIGLRKICIGYGQFF